MIFKKISKGCAVVLALLNIAYPYCQVFSAKPEEQKIDCRDIPLNYREISEGALEQMHHHFSCVKDVGSTPVERYSTYITLPDGREVKLIAYNARALFRDGNSFRRVEGLKFEDFDKVGMDPYMP